jgi:hypothetical protein
MLSLFGSEGAFLEPKLRWADEPDDRREPSERWSECGAEWARGVRLELERCGEPTGDKSWSSFLELAGLACVACVA